VKVAFFASEEGARIEFREAAHRSLPDHAPYISAPLALDLGAAVDPGEIAVILKEAC